MFDIGFSELVVVGLIALIVLGPKRLPEVARAAGRWTTRLRRFIDNTKREIDREIKDEDLAALKDVHREIIETRDFLGKSASDAMGSASEYMGKGLSDPFYDTPSIAKTETTNTPSAQTTKPKKTKKASKPKKSKPTTRQRTREPARRKTHGRRKPPAS